LYDSASFLAIYNKDILKKHIYITIISILFLAILAVSTPACSRKSGCPAEDAQSQVDKHGRYKSSKTTSGLGLIPKDAKKRKKN
jgi:hypothetical protein